MGVEERRAVPCGATVKTCLSKGIFVLTSRPIASILKGNIFMRGMFFSYIRKSFAEICLNCYSIWCSAKFFDSHKWNVVTSKAMVECQLDLTSIINYYIWGYFRQYKQQPKRYKNIPLLLIFLFSLIWSSEEPVRLPCPILEGIASICFRFHFQQTLQIQIQGSLGCQKIRKIVRNLKLPITRSTIYLSLSKIKYNLPFFMEFWYIS